MTSVIFPLRTVLIFDGGPSAEENERVQIAICQRWMGQASDRADGQQIKDLHTLGVSVSEIARQVKVSRKTVYRYLRS